MWPPLGHARRNASGVRLDPAQMMIDTSGRPNVHDTVFVEADVDGRPVPFRAVVVNVMPDCLWLGLVKPDPRLERVRGGAPVTLTFRRKGAGLVASETFLSHLGTTQSRLFSVAWGGECELVQRRSNLRINAACPIEYVVVQSEVTEPGTSGSGKTRNISAGGLQLSVGRPADDTVAEGDLLELRVWLDSGIVLADATVVRVEDLTDIGPDGKPVPPNKATHAPVTAIAVQFESISDTAQDRIVRYIFSLQRMQKDLRAGGG
jgi:c-di-GMP-binding flagellar brake protein YcgR